MSKILIQEAKKYESEGNISQAIISFKKVLQLEPENYIIQLELGNLCASNKQFEEAAGYFRRCLYQFKDNIEIKNIKVTFKQLLRAQKCQTFQKIIKKSI